uniref:Uncharacterized protein n=1 Tax=viral metagenome TaxID=1070528 RepID=A0A6H1ZKI6_9ZZZZ
MTEPSIEVVINEVKNLAREVREGFRGVHARQDISNGKISKHAGLIANLEKEDIQMKNSIKSGKGMWLTITTLLGIVLTLLGVYVW